MKGISTRPNALAEARYTLARSKCPEKLDKRAVGAQPARTPSRQAAADDAGGHPLVGYAIADARLGFISTAATHESPVDLLAEATGGQTELMPWRKSANLEPLSEVKPDALDHPLARSLAHAGPSLSASAEQTDYGLPADGDPHAAQGDIDGRIARFCEMNSPPKYVPPPFLDQDDSGNPTQEEKGARRAHVIAMKDCIAGHKRTTRAFSDLLYEATGVLLLDRNSVDKHPLVMRVRSGSPAFVAGVRLGDELRFVDPQAHQMHMHLVCGFDVLGLTFEGICQLIAGQQPLTSQAIESVQTFETSQMQLRFVCPKSKRECQVPVKPDEMQGKLRQMRAASKHLGGISQKEIENKLWGLFWEMDADGSGEIEPDELRQGLERIDCNMTDEMMRAMFSEVDRDGNGFIEWHEFRDAMICIYGNSYMNRYPSWCLAREKLRDWMMTTDPRSALERLWPLVIIFSSLHVFSTAFQILLGFPLNFRDSASIGHRDSPGVNSSAAYLRCAGMVIASIFASSGIFVGIRYGRTSVLVVVGACQVLGTCLTASAGIMSARSSPSPEQAAWQRLSSLAVILTGSQAATLSLLIGIRLSIYHWWQRLVDACLLEQVVRKCESCLLGSDALPNESKALATF